MGRFSIRQRIFWGSVGLGTVPLAAALLVLAVQARSAGPTGGTRAALDEIARSGRTLIATLDTARLDSGATHALDAHTRAITQSTVMARRADMLTRTAAAALGAVVLGAAAVLVTLSLWSAGRWAGAISRPVEDLVDRVRRIQHLEPLPPPGPGPGPPEFDAVRLALADMAYDLDRARQQAVERERLVAFRETARRVAHEIRGPLTSIRLAAAQMGATGPAGEVVRDEIDRLETLAQDFAEFGRLADGPVTAVDLDTLLREVATSTLPPGRPWHLTSNGPTLIDARYEALRRAIHNLLQNADQVAPTGTPIEITLETRNGAATIGIRDHGPGVPADLGSRIFDPYVTTRPGGTGLGLAIARNAVDAHGGHITLESPTDGGTRMVVTLPCS